MVKLPKMMLRVLGWLLRALLPELNAMPRFLRKRLTKEAPQTPRSTRPVDGPRGLLLKLDHYRRAHHMKGFNEKFMTKCEARRRGSYRRACAFETRASPIPCVANGRLRHKGEGAERVRCQPQHARLAPPAGHAAAGCVPYGIPDGRSDSGCGRHAEAGIHRGMRGPRQTMDTTRRGRQVLANVVHVGLPEPARRLPPWRGSARAASP